MELAAHPDDGGERCGRCLTPSSRDSTLFVLLIRPAITLDEEIR
jgi:hypothetical protein